MLKSGRAGSVSQAIQLAVGIVRKWSEGIPVGGETQVGGGKEGKHPGHIHPDVQAAAKAAMADWNNKRAIAHAAAAARAAQASEHSMTYDPWGQEVVDLAGVTPSFGGSVMPMGSGMTSTKPYQGNPGYGAVRVTRQEHVHKPVGMPTEKNYGGMKPASQMSSDELRSHVKGMHAKSTNGKSNGQVVSMHTRLHRGAPEYLRTGDRKPATTNRTAPVPKEPRRGQPQGTVPPVAPGAVRTQKQAAKSGKRNVSMPTHMLSATYDSRGSVIDLAVVPSPTAATRKGALKQGLALPHPSGSPGKARFPLTNRTLASRAVKMVQLAKGDKTAIRRYIMRVLRGKGWADLIPDNWNADGTTSGS
jgi:hypothetical protein